MGLLRDSRTRLLGWPCPWPQLRALEISTLPTPRSHAWVVSPFLLLHSKAGAGGGTLGSRAEEGGSRGSQTDRRIPCFRLREEGTYCFLGSQPTGGVCGNPAHSSHRSLLSYVAPGPESCPAITNGALCSRDKEHAPHPQPGPGLVCLAPTLASEGIVPLPGGETEV